MTLQIQPVLSRRQLLLGSLGLLAAASPALRALAQGGGTLTLGTKLDLNTLDPHFFNGFPQGSSHSQIFETLVGLDEGLGLRPGLATSWRVVDDLTWEFTLRQNVVFHDGSPFGADDVIATLARVPNVPNSPNLFTTFTRSIQAAEKLGEHAIRFRTAQPNPGLPNDLARVFVIARKFAAASTADFNSGAAAMGTGPYRVAEWAQGERLTLDRYSGYWGGAAPWARVVERIIKSDAGRVAALLSGDVDAIDEVPSLDMGRFQQDSRFRITTGPAAVVHYMALDSARDESPFVGPKQGQPALKGNPLRDRRVRKALSLGINRQLIVERLLDGTAIAASQFLPTSFAGTSRKLQPDPFDPDRARALLAEAGFGAGFRITLHATNDRYPKDRDIAQAIGQTWTRMGLQVEIEAVPGNVFFPQATQQKYSAFIAQYGTDDASQGPRALIHTFDTAGGYGSANRVRYSNPAVDAIVEKAAVEMNADRRLVLLAEAIDACLEDQAFIPILHPKWVLAGKANLTITPRPERRFNALMIRG